MSDSARDALATGVLAVALAAVYGALPSGRYDLDTLPELARVERGELVHPDPAHGLYVPLGWAIWRAAGWIVPDVPARDALLWANALLGAVAIAAFAAVLRRSGIDRATTLAVATCAGVAYGFWSHAADTFFIVPAAAAALIAWWAALSAGADGPHRRAWHVASGAAFGVAALLHQANLLVAPALLIASRRPGATARDALRSAIFPACAALLVTLPFWSVQAASAGIAPHEVPGWFVGTHGGIARGLWRREGVPIASATLLAWLATIVPVYEGMRLRDLLQGAISPRHVPAQVALTLTGLVVGAATAGWVRGRRLRQFRLDAPFAAAMLWFVLPGCAVLWFDRAEVKLWIIPFFGLWVVLARGLEALAAVATGRAALAARAAAPSLAAALLLGNLLVFALPARFEPWPDREKAQVAASWLEPGDVVVSAGFDWTGQLAYACPACRVVNLIDAAQTGLEAEEVLDRVRAEARSAGGEVFLVGPLGDASSPAWRDGIAQFAELPRSSIEALAPTVAWTFDDGEVVWRAAVPGAER